jgi:hypothetical protein
MSTAAPATQSTGYSLARPHGKCTVCGRGIGKGEKFTAAVREGGAGLERLDVGAECWETVDKKPLLAHWRATMPDSEGPARPKVFVDDAVLCDLFERLAETPLGDIAEGEGSATAKANFRFVLGLILMRKRLLTYESTHVANGQEFWSVRLKGREQAFDLPNPRLDEQQVMQVSEQLGQILSGDAA